MENLQQIAARVVRSSVLPTARNTNRQKGTLFYKSDECNRCKGMGWISSGDTATRCPCFQERKIRAMLPARYHNSRVEDFCEEVRQHTRDWMAQLPKHSLLLTGSTGTGKTYMAAAITRSLIENGEVVLFKRACEYYSAVQKSFNQPNISKDHVMQEYGECPMLVLDDLGSGSLSDHERRCTLELLDVRLDSLRPMIVTTNWTIAQVGERIDQRIASRLREFKVLKFVGDDQRGLRGRR